MAKTLEMPKLSPTMEEGQIGTWSKKEGDAVAVDDLLCEVETDKATMEFRSFDQGTLLKILAPAGSVVKLGQPVAILGEPGEDISQLGGAPPAAQPAAAGTQPAAGGTQPAAAAAQPAAGGTQPAAAAAQPAAPEPAPAAAQAPAPPAAAQAPAEPPRPAQAKPAPARAASPGAGSTQPPSAPAATAQDTSGRVKASPYVRKLARERGISLYDLAGSGPNGRIIARDLDLERASGASPRDGRPSNELAQPESHPLSMMRKTIARRLTESKQTVPHFYLTIDVDADPLHQLRERVNADLAANEGDHPLKVSFNDLLIKACAITLTKVPAANAQFTPEAILFHHRVDISVAVAVDDGLLTPVVRDADRKSVLDIAVEVRDLADRAKKKKLAPEEMSNGTFSISNLGMYGIDVFSAVINPPEGAILAVGQVRKEPVVRGDEIVVGRKLAMTMSCDHRVIDGAIGATFLKALRALLEHPSQILLY